ncbi:MAG: lantibiotic dehydratase [Parachlamydiaceae bacterium]|nr:lantibiotic dehydratase [Parachlamydiaceae bacterium]
MCKKIYGAASSFLLRIPTWPIDKFGYFLSDHPMKSPLEIYFRNEQLREAIAIASPSLHNSLKKKDPKNLNQVAKSLSHYISRMKIRPTPFGLFSSVSSANWEGSTSIFFDERFLRKRTRLDMEWVYLLIQKLYQNENSFFTLPVRTNPLLQLSGERYQLDYIRYANNDDKGAPYPSLTKSIRASPLIKLILEYAKEGISVDHIWLKLQMSVPILDQNKTFSVIRQLFSQQFLIPKLLPSLLSSTPFDILHANLPLFPGLKEIFEEIKHYNELPFGKGEVALEKLQENMAALVPNKNYLQVDTALEGKKFGLSKNILAELEKTLHLLWKIFCVRNNSSTLAAYHSKFIEKYGEHRTVPLLELLDEEKGLGPLYENSIASSPDLEWEKWLSQRWQDCLFHKKKEWVLTEENIDNFLLSQKKRIDPVNAPLSLDILCKVFADSNQNIDLGEFLLVISEITNEGGSLCGRFLDLLGNDAQAEIAHFFKLEEQLETQSLFVELSCLPEAVRSGNVTIHPCLRSHRLDIEGETGQEGGLSLEDIYVGATLSKFYLTDKESQINIITRANHVLNISLESLPIRFMRYITRSQYPSIPLFSWGSLQETAIFLPRVSFGKTILSLAKWNIDPKPYLKESSEKNISSFNAWAEQWDLPQSFFMAHGDQHLLLDRSYPHHVDEIISKLKKGETLKFIEKIEGAWIKGNEGNHICEISVPFVKNAKYARKESPIKASPYSPNINEERCKFPGSNWLYLKIYIRLKKIDEFLTGHLYNFIEGFRQTGKLNEWFIVRYLEPDSHLRLRIHSESFEMISQILFAFDEQFKLWTHLGWIKDVSIAKYERETERYGGSSLIEAAETMFHRDTLATLLTIHAFITKQIQCEEIVLQALSIINFLHNYGLKVDEAVYILNKSIISEVELKGFRQYKIALIKLIKELRDSHSIIPEIQVMNAASQIRMEGIHHFCKLAGPLERDRWNSIIESLLHMHCNRLGCLGQGEIRAKLYARQALLSIVNNESDNLHFSINQVVRK